MGCLSGLCFVMTSCVLTSASSVVKRSDDASPLESIVERLTQDVTKMQADLQALKNKDAKRVAFLANVGGTPTNLITAPASSPIHFASVNFNMGKAFDPTLGVFTVPFSGVYILTFQLFPSFHGDTLIDLMRNGGILLRSRVHNPVIEDSEASSTVVHATAGEKFWVQINQSGKIEYGPHSFFSGALLSLD